VNSWYSTIPHAKMSTQNRICLTVEFTLGKTSLFSNAFPIPNRQTGSHP
jgi:hypothetical protein